MTSPHEPVRMRFRDHMRRLPLMSFAAAFQRDLESTARALDTLIQGPPDAGAGPPLSHDNRTGSPELPLHGEGGKGGGERSETLKENLRERSDRSDRERSRWAPQANDRDLAHHFATALDDTENFAAILKLVRTYPEPLLDDALRRTLAVPADRIRGTRGAIFTGIVRRLASGDGARPTHS